MSKNSLLFLRRGLLRVIPVALGLFGAIPASAGTAQVQGCFVGLCIEGTTTVTFTASGVSISEFTVSPGYFGSGTTDLLVGGSLNLYASGSAYDGGLLPGEALFDEGNLGEAGEVMASWVPLTWDLSGAPGDMTLTISGPALLCGPIACVSAPASQGPGFIAITEAYIPTPTAPGTGIPTPEPSSLVLLGTGLLGLFPVIRRRFTQS